jgi:glycogen synthase
VRVLAIGNLFPPAAAGGYERVWVGVVDALCRAGHDVRVLTSDTPAPAGGGLAPENAVPVARELRWYWRDHEFLQLPWRERLALERHNSQVLARHLEHGTDVVSWWGMGGMSLSLIEQVRRTGVPAVGLVGDGWMAYGFDADGWVGGWRRRPRLARLTERLVGVPTRVDLAGAALWVFISHALETRLAERGLRLPRTSVAHPGVDPDRFREQPAREWSWRLAYIGRVETPKGVATAIEALARVDGGATLTIDGAGEADHLRELEALGERLGVADRVRFQRSSSDAIADVYAAADAIVFPVTWPEPWGLVPLEAMSVGRPVIATGTGGSAEYLEDRSNCLLFTPGDAEDLARRLSELAGDERLRSRLRAGGLETATRFSQEAFERVMVAVLEDAADAGAAAPPITESRPSRTP